MPTLSGDGHGWISKFYILPKFNCFLVSARLGRGQSSQGRKVAFFCVFSNTLLVLVELLYYNNEGKNY